MITERDKTNRRILVIDDNPQIHADFRKILASRSPASVDLDKAAAELFGTSSSPSDATATEGFELTFAHQGQQGLEAVHAAVQAGRPFALAFVDVRMPPGWDGIETTTRLWAVDPDLQVSICTAYSDYSWDEMIARLGVSDRMVILKKPFDSIEVLQLAHALTAKRRHLEEARDNLHNLEKIVEARTSELRKSEERYRLISENMAELISILDADAGVLYSSPSYHRLLGCSAEDLSRKGILDLIHPEDQECVLGMIRGILESGSCEVLEYRVRHANGAWRTFESHAVPFRNGAGERQSVLAVARDVTERKQLELQLRQAQRLESIGQLAAGIAHEINTPIQFVGDNTNFVRDAFATIWQVFEAQTRMVESARHGTLDQAGLDQFEHVLRDADLEYLAAEVPRALNESLEGVDRVRQIVRAMKEFSHPGAEEKTPVDLRKAIESTLIVCRNEWKHVAELVTDFEPGLPSVPVLPGEFNQVILNLVVNAAHAIAEALGPESREKGTITVSLRREGSWAELRVQDTGGGVPEAIRERIFDPFFTTKEVGRGTGQGLAIARSVVVDKHRGELTFDTEPGRGTTFLIRLPLESSEQAVVVDVG